MFNVRVQGKTMKLSLLTLAVFSEIVMSHDSYIPHERLAFGLFMSFGMIIVVFYSLKRIKIYKRDKKKYNNQ